MRAQRAMFKQKRCAFFTPSVWVWSILLSCQIGLLCNSTTMASEDADFKSNLAKLEIKFFHHDYAKDETKDRLDRLDNMIFGEVRSGTAEERIRNLLDTVPNLKSKVDTGLDSDRSSDLALPQAEGGPLPEGSSSSLNPQAPSKASSTTGKENLTRSSGNSGPGTDESASDTDSGQIGSYPAVAAIEKKILGKDHITEPLSKRLDRLELKAFGKTNASEDFIDRVDRLKRITNTDITKTVPAGSDWADEQDDEGGVPANSSVPDNLSSGDDGVQPFTGLSRRGSDGASYGDPYAGTGTFGAGGYGNPSRKNIVSEGPVRKTVPGSYGLPAANDSNPLTSPYGSSAPHPAPDYNRVAGNSSSGVVPSAAPAYGSSGAGAGLGLKDQIGLMEREIFQKEYAGETIPSRLNRLETAVFPKDASAVNKSLPERVSRLLAAVPLSTATTQYLASKRRPTRSADPDFPELDDMDFGGPQPAPPRQQSKLSRIIGGMGNMLTGGYAGGYAGQAGTLVTDPQTGLLFDQYTGSLIDPLTGAVVGRRASSAGGYNNGFNSGFSPASPFGMGGSGMQFGIGGGGLRFGSGMWP